MRLLKSAEEIIQVVNLHAPAIRQVVNVGIPRGLLDVHCGIRPKSRANPSGQTAGSQRDVVFERVRRIVRGTHRLDVHRQNQRLRTELRRGELFLRGRPDGLGIFGVNFQVDAQSAFKVQVNPFVGGVAREEFKDVGQRQPLRMVVRRLSSNKFLWHTAFALQFPDVVVGRALGIPDVGEAAVFGQGLDIAVVVGVQDGQLRDFGVEIAGQRRGQQVVFVEKCHN